jgi:hypothetical protein
MSDNDLDTYTGLPRIAYEVMPTGGIVSLALSASGTALLERQAGDGAWQSLYDGEPLPLWIDDGSLLNAPLDASTAYTYRLTDANGVVVTPAITPAATLSLEPDGVLSLIMRMMQAGFTNLPMPSGYVRPRIVHAMPLTWGGTPILPIVTINLDYGPVMEEVQIGQGVNAYLSETGVVTSQVRRRFSITALSLSAAEREFYRDAILKIFSVMAPRVFGKIWDDTRFSFQAYSSQKSKDEMGPGFYYTQVMLDLVGSLNAFVANDYGVMEVIDITPTGEVDTTSYD